MYTLLLILIKKAKQVDYDTQKQKLMEKFFKETI